jgi:hypothetical protein
MSRIAKFFDLHADPYERADITSNTYWDCLINDAYLAYAAQAHAAEFLATFREFPPSQRAVSFTVDQSWSSCRSPRRTDGDTRRELGGDPYARSRRLRDRL